MVKDKPLVVFGKHQFVAEEDDEIEFQTGDPILVLEKDEEFNDGWWKGRTKKGEIGLFPVNFTTTENIFNVNIDSLLETESPKSIEHSYIPNITDDDSFQPAVSPFGTYSNSLSLNTSGEGIHKSFIKSTELTNSFGVEIRPPSPDSVNSMRALSSPKLSTSFTNSFRHLGGDLDRIDVTRNKLYSQPYSQHYSQSYSQPYSQTNSHSQTHISQHFSHTQNSESRATTTSHNQTKKPQEWSVEDVCDWLTSNNYEKIVPAVKENKITGEKLLELNLSKLREFGINSLSERIELLHEILTIREEYNSDHQDLKYSTTNNSANEGSAFTSDFESYNEAMKLSKKSIDQAIQKASLNFSLGDIHNKPHDDYEEEEPKNLEEESEASNSNYFEDEKEPLKSYYYNDEGESSNALKDLLNVRNNSNPEKRHHELPVSANLYLSPEVPTANNQLGNGGYAGGMAGIAGISMNMGNRNRSVSLENMPMGGNIQYNAKNISNVSLPLMNNKSKIYFKNAERKGWLFVRFDNEVEWNRRWIVLLETRLYILKSSTEQEESFSGGGDTRLSQILNTIDLNPNCTVLPDLMDKSKPHNFLFKDPILGIIHLAADDQLGVVTWINYIVRACTNTQKKPTPLIPLKNIGRQAKETIQTISAQESDYYSPKMSKKSSANIAINGILSPNMKNEYLSSYKNSDDEPSSNVTKKKGMLSIITNRIHQNSPISPTQTAAAAANGWYRTNARSATDYSNYRNLKQVSPETRLRLQKTAKLTDPVIMTPILRTNKLKSFNPNQMEQEEEFGMSSESSLLNFNKKPDYLVGINSSSNHSMSSNYLGFLPGQSSLTANSQVSPIEMMERRGIGSFITNSRQKKMKKSGKKSSILFW